MFSPTEASQSRVHALDAVRAFALLLGVAFHAALSFAPLAREHLVAPVDDRGGTLVTVALILPIHMFRMQLFFVMAGFFSQTAMLRKGIRGFCVDRVQRILLPLVLAWLIVMPMVSEAWIWGTTHKPASLAQAFPTGLSLHLFPLSYLWFLYFLVLFCALYAAGTALVRTVDPDGRIAALGDRLFSRVFRNGWIAIACLSLPFCALVVGAGIDWAVSAGVPTPSVSLVPPKIPFALYGTAFIVGLLLSRNRGVLDRLRARWQIHILAGVAASAVCLWIFFRSNSHFTPSRSAPEHLLFAICYITGSWCWVLGITGFALRMFSRASPTKRYVADASYWIYLSHYPIVLALQDMLANVELPAILKFLLILTVTFSLCFLTYHYAVRSTLIGKLLNGKRYPRGARPPSTPVQLKV